MRRFAISDIHGCAATFKALLEKLKFSKEDELYLLGDYIDRGPDSKGVIDHIWHLQKEGYTVNCLRGNHEQMLIDEIEKPHSYSSGDVTTLQSFGVSNSQEIPKGYIEWMKDLDYYFEVDQYILVHAGLNFDAENPLEDFYEMIWIRHWTEDIDKEWLGDRIIIHGHTPTKELEIKQYVKTLKEVPALVIDNGCVFESFGLGNLIAFDLDTQELHFMPRVDK